MNSTDAAARAVILDLHYTQRKPLTEVAEVLGMSVYFLHQKMDELRIRPRGGSRGGTPVLFYDPNAPVLDCLNCADGTPCGPECPNWEDR